MTGSFFDHHDVTIEKTIAIWRVFLRNYMKNHFFLNIWTEIDRMQVRTDLRSVKNSNTT